MDFYGTIGPACAQPAILQHMVEAGMTGIRMNLSHGPLAAHTDWLAMIRAAGIRQLLKYFPYAPDAQAKGSDNQGSTNFFMLVEECPYCSHPVGGYRRSIGG